MLIFSDDTDPYNKPSIYATEDGNYLVLFVSTAKEHGNMVKVSQFVDGILSNPASIQWISIFGDYSTEAGYLTNEGTRFWFYVSHPEKSPRGKIVAIDLSDIEGGFTDVVPETIDTLTDVTVVYGDRLVLVYLREVKHVMYIHELDTGKRIGQLDVPLGTISDTSGRKRYSDFFVSLAIAF